MPPPSPDPGITIRPLAGFAEYEECLALQRAAWGDDFGELVAPTLLLVAQKVGGIAAGAFDADNRLVGFVFGLTGWREGRPVHWSHMLAVREAVRDRGIGRRLKLYQREQLRAVGVERVYWTFDPLVARNAHLNLNRLGARVVEYVTDMYGAGPLSRTDRVIGSDRFIVEWRLTDEPPSEVPAPESDAPIVTLAPHPDPHATPELPDRAEVRVEIPRDIQRLKVEAPELAMGWRRLTRLGLTHYLARGHRVVGLARSGDRCFYVVRCTGPDA